MKLDIVHSIIYNIHRYYFTILLIFSKNVYAQKVKIPNTERIFFFNLKSFKPR